MKKLLIVEDNVGLTGVLFETLIDVFDIIETVYDVDEACKMLSENTFAVVILDINLNNRNGAEVVKFVKDNASNTNQKTPFVIISGLITPKFIEHYSDRFAAIVMKPFEDLEIRRIVENVLSTISIEDEIVNDDIPDVKCIGPFAVDALKEQVDQVMVQVKKSAKLKSLFKQAKVDRNADNYVSTHIGMIVNISAAICIKMDWSSDKTIEKFVYAAYLHDMSLASRPDLARINTFEKLEIFKDKLSEDDYKLVFDHSTIAAKTITNFNEVPPDVEMMIRQHHELPNQTGFPNAIGYQKITPFSAVFIVAHSLADYIIENPKWTMDDFVKRYRSRLHGSHFTKIMRSLLDIK